MTHMLVDIYFKEQLDFIKEQIKIQTKSNLNCKFGLARFGESTHQVWYTNNTKTTLTIIPKKYNIISHELIDLNELKGVQLYTFLCDVSDKELTYKHTLNIDKKTYDIYVTSDNEEIAINPNLIKNFKGHDEFKFYGKHYNTPVYVKYNDEVVKIVLPIKRY